MAIVAKYLRDYENVDTGRLKNMSGVEVIELCRQSEICSGWGQLAEILKRYKNCIEQERLR